MPSRSRNVSRGAQRGHPPRPRIIVGGRYVVQKQNLTYHPGHILKIRYNDRRQRQYFIHYEDQNSRLDEWVSYDRIIRQIPSCLRFKRFSQSQFTVETITPYTASELERRIIRNIDVIHFGKFEIEAWYYSPYPDDYGAVSKLFICEYCLKYMMFENTYRNHLGSCQRRNPPGKEIYRNGELSVYELVPENHQLLYCQNLCLLGKLFIESKSEVFNIGAFYFYVLYEVDLQGSHMIGYFSKNKNHPEHNVSSIMTLPPHQKKGYGTMLVSFSYELNKLQGVVGTPEKPLSDLGNRCFKSYWSWVITDILRGLNDSMTIKQISMMTSMTMVDIMHTLSSLKLLSRWIVRDTIRVTPTLVYEQTVAAHVNKPRLLVDKCEIHWDPIQGTSRDDNEESNPMLREERDYMRLQGIIIMNENQNQT